VFGCALDERVRRGSRGLDHHHDRRADFHDNYDDNNHDCRNANRTDCHRRRACGVPTDSGVVAWCFT
jgi:hypothetical protein